MSYAPEHDAALRGSAFKRCGCGRLLRVAATAWTSHAQEVLVWICPSCDRGKLGRVEVREP